MCFKTQCLTKTKVLLNLRSKQFGDWVFKCVDLTLRTPLKLQHYVTQNI